jgi:hypothetical protein
MTEDMTLNEVSCCECGKPIPTIPQWLSGVQVKFQCEECRQKHPRVPGIAEAEPRHRINEVDELGELGDVVEGAEEEDLDDEEMGSDGGEGYE